VAAHGGKGESLAQQIYRDDKISSNKGGRMTKKHYSVHWEDEQAVSFEVDGVTYNNLNEIPDKRDKHKLQEMMEAASEPTFDEQEWEQTQKEANKGFQIILWVFSGVAALMLLIAGIASFTNVTKIANERSADGTVVDMVMRYAYDENDRSRVVGEVYYPVVRFTADDGHRRDVHLSEGSYPPAYEIGDPVTVRYDPQHPLDARIDSSGSTLLMWILPAITGVLGLAFLGAVLAVRWLSK
jgi:hypothetical protein